jgi:hypothetical protein
MHKILHILFFSSCSFIVTDIDAQKWTAGLYSQAHFPQTDYKAIYPKTGVGMGLDVLYTPAKDGLISFGGEIGMLFLRTARRRVDPYEFGVGNTHQLIASNNIINLGAKARINLIRDTEKPVRVYIEGKAGTNVFSRSVELQQLITGETDASVSRTNWGLYGGPGAGVSVAIGEKRKVVVFAQAAYLWGSTTTYYSHPRINEVNKPVFTANRSTTDMILAQLGLRFKLEGS